MLNIAHLFHRHVVLVLFVPVCLLSIMATVFRQAQLFYLSSQLI